MPEYLLRIFPVREYGDVPVGKRAGSSGEFGKDNRDMSEDNKIEKMEEAEISELLAGQAFIPKNVVQNYMDTGGQQISDMDPAHAVQVFHVLSEDGEMVEAELLELLDIDDRTFAIYRAPVKEGGELAVDACYVEKDQNGFDHIAIITDLGDQRMIRDYINSEWR